MLPGRRRTTSFSFDEETLGNLKALAARRHRGSVSALLAEVASREAKFVAVDAFLAKYDVPALTEAAGDAIEAEWRPAPRKRARNGAA